MPASNLTAPVGDAHPRRRARPVRSVWVLVCQSGYPHASRVYGTREVALADKSLIDASCDTKDHRIVTYVATLEKFVDELAVKRTPP